jgi:hypothetical protein
MTILRRIRCALSASHRTETWADTLTWCVRCGKEWER